MIKSLREFNVDFMYHQKTPQGNRRLVDFLRRQFFTPAERGVSLDAFRKSLSVVNLYGAKKKK